MKIITEIIGGAQGLLNIPYHLQDVFAYIMGFGRSAASAHQKLCRDRENTIPVSAFCTKRPGEMFFQNYYNDATHRAAENRFNVAAAVRF
jgi:hypothetical protein